MLRQWLVGPVLDLGRRGDINLTQAQARKVGLALLNWSEEVQENGCVLRGDPRFCDVEEAEEDRVSFEGDMFE